MRQLILLMTSLIAIPLIGMQAPNDLSERLINAIRNADYQGMVSLLNAYPILLNNIRGYYNYTSDPILVYAKRNPEKSATYMKIARFLVNNGAIIRSQALAELEAFEKPATPAPSYAQPVYYQPASAYSPTQPVYHHQPAPYMPPQPVYQQPVYQQPLAPKPQALPAQQISSQTTEAKYQSLLKAAVSGDANEITKILSQINPGELSLKQQDDILTRAASTLFLYVLDYKQLSESKKIIKLLLSKGIIPQSPFLKSRIDLHLKNQGLGNRSALIKPPLIEAIFNRNEAEVRRLITQEHVDVNEPDSVGRTPLEIATANPNKTIIELLLQYGASTQGLRADQRASLSKMVGRPI